MPASCPSRSKLLMLKNDKLLLTCRIRQQNCVMLPSPSVLELRPTDRAQSPP